jgi:hypothetical protein
LRTNPTSRLRSREKNSVQEARWVSVMVVKTEKEGIYCIDTWQTVSDGA